PCATGPASPTSTAACPAARSSRCADCATAEPRGPGDSPSTWPAATAMKTRSCPPAPSRALPKTPWTALQVSTSAPPTSDRQHHNWHDHVNPRKTSGRDHLGSVGPRRRGGADGRLKREPQHLADIAHRVHVELLEHLGRNIVQVRLVPLRDQHHGHPGS